MRQPKNYTKLAEPISDFFVTYEVSPPVRARRALNYIKTEKRFLIELRFRSDFDLALFEKFVNGSPVRLLEFQGANGKIRFFITDSRMPDHGSTEIAWQWAETEIPRIGASIALHFPEFVLPTCRCVIDLDGENGPAPSPPGFKTKVLGQSNIPDFQTVMSDASEFAPYATKCGSDGDYGDALMYVGQALDIDRENRWASLYRAYEIVADRFGGDRSLAASGSSLCSKGQLERFTRTCNHQEAVGAFSRHARSKAVPPRNPMDIEEALRFVLDLIRAWYSSGR